MDISLGSTFKFRALKQNTVLIVPSFSKDLILVLVAEGSIEPVFCFVVTRDVSKRPSSGRRQTIINK